MSENERSKVLVTGAAGMLGSQVLLSVLDEVQVVGTDLREGAGVDAPGVDLADPAAVAELFDEHGPFGGVIHTAAYTAVDAAEEHEAEATRANVDAVRVLAAACAAAEGAAGMLAGALPLVVVSTDFVFDGTDKRPYREDDEPNPLGVYGRTKLAGERAAQEAHPAGARVVRTQWLYGPRGKHFPATMLNLAKQRRELRVVDDQVGCPTSTLELAPALWDVLLSGEAGVYHAACEGACSWYDLALATLEASGVKDVKVAPCTTEEFPRPAPRPAYSVLDCSKLTALRGHPLAPWREALMTYLGSSSS